MHCRRSFTQGLLLRSYQEKFVREIPFYSYSQIRSPYMFSWQRAVISLRIVSSFPREKKTIR